MKRRTGLTCTVAILTLLLLVTNVHAATPSTYLHVADIGDLSSIEGGCNAEISGWPLVKIITTPGGDFGVYADYLLSDQRDPQTDSATGWRTRWVVSVKFSLRLTNAQHITVGYDEYSNDYVLEYSSDSAVASGQLQIASHGRGLYHAFLRCTAYSIKQGRNPSGAWEQLGSTNADTSEIWLNIRVSGTGKTVEELCDRGVISVIC